MISAESKSGSETAPSDLEGLAKASRALLSDAIKEHHPLIAMACSFSVEDLVVLDLLSAVRPDARIFAIDTGRLPGETFVCAEQIRRRYSFNLTWYFPRAQDVEALLNTEGAFSFRTSLAARHACCGIRKVEPLQRALSGLTAWITGMRRDQSVTRTALAPREVDEAHGKIAKYNPLAAWTSGHVWVYARTRSLPWNTLYGRGYRSIGCEPCTRAVEPGDDERSGRWWWENPEHKECGLHVRHEIIEPAGGGI